MHRPHRQNKICVTIRVRSQGSYGLPVNLEKFDLVGFFACPPCSVTYQQQSTPFWVFLCCRQDDGGEVEERAKMGSLKEGAERGEAKDKEYEQEDEEEPILREQKRRFCMFPIRYKQLLEMYKKAEASFWTGTYSLFLAILSPTLTKCPVTIHLFPQRKKCVMIHTYISEQVISKLKEFLYGHFLLL